MERIIITLLILGATYYLLTYQSEKAPEKPLTSTKETQTSPDRENPDESALIEEIITQIKDLTQQL